MSNRFCLSSNCDIKFINQAQEVRLNVNDDILFFAEKLTSEKKTILLPYPIALPTGLNLNNIEKVIKHPIVFYLTDINQVGVMQKYNLKWFYDYPIDTFAEYNRLLDLGAYYIRICGELFHAIPYLVENAPEGFGGLRLAPNIAYYATIPARNGVPGEWVRPEDLAALKPYNLTFEFENVEDNHKKEEALFRVYREGKWQGDINSIITNLNYSADNELIEPALIEKRITCGQRCQMGGSCHLCYRYLKIANREFVNKAKESV